MRTLNVHDKTIFLHDDDAAQLEAADVIYLCGDPDHDHDYHINPEDDTVRGVEDLVLAAARGTQEVQPPSLESSGIETITMEGVIGRDIALPMSPDALDKRIKFLERNLALNAATTLLKRGNFETVNRMRVDEGVDVSVSLTVITAKKRRDFAFLAKGWIIAAIKAMPGVSDQRKDDAIALIRDA